MSEWRVTIKATISVDDPDILSKLVLCRMKTDEAGTIKAIIMDDDFEVVEYPDDWLDFTEVMRDNKQRCMQSTYNVKQTRTKTERKEQ